MRIRDEEKGDHGVVHSLNEAAFGNPAEANLVDALRQQAQPFISLVAVNGGEVVGHIMFSPVTLAGYPNLRIMGLAPMAVVPGHQRRGIGSALVEAGLERCRQLDYDGVVVLGHPEFYPRFGFQPSVRFGIRSEYEVPDEVFMAMELQPGSLREVSGTVQYHPAFANL